MKTVYPLQTKFAGGITNKQGNSTAYFKKEFDFCYTSRGVKSNKIYDKRLYVQDILFIDLPVSVLGPSSRQKYV